MLEERLYFTTLKTRAGWIGMCGSSAGLARTTLPKQSRESAELALGEAVSERRCSQEYFKDLCQKLSAFFEGSRVDFSEKLDLTSATPFERSVWEATRLIPYGETRSYVWVARRIGRPLASRAVGHALGKNPLPIVIPCHRVIASNGKLCGFGGGLEMKQSLLNLESKK